ncbi:MAG: phenylacetate--CoA ligase family protein [Theionarchaea archaeon]|nr:phenylacetate--CoA ligase family protein [Theionarchaea archaeon]
MFLRQMYYLQQVMRNQWKTPQELEKLQEKKLRHLLNHAYTNTIFYHRKFKEAHIHPSDFHHLKDLRKFPITTKEELRQNYPHNTLARNYNLSKGIESQTSGSTGRVFTFFCSYAALDYHMAISYRNFAILGYKPWQKLAYIRYSPVEIPETWYKQLGLMRHIHIDVNKSIPDQINTICHHNPQVITGYPSILLEWAKFIEKNGITINPHFVRCEAEILTKESRTYMKNIFKCDLFDEYGSAEMVQYAFECPEHNYHISVDNAVLEFLDDSEPVAPGEQGEVIATSLPHYGMPFIRYKLLDWGVPAEGVCTCGRGLPLMKLVVGRDDDFVILPSGKKVGPRLIIPLFEHIHGINEYRIIQEKKNFITIEIIKGEQYTLKVEDYLKKNINSILNESVELNFVYVKEIPRGRHNRPRPFVSKVRS